MNVIVSQMNKKIIKPTSFGSVCIIWSVSNRIPKIVRVLLSKPGLTAESQASELYPDSRISSCAEIDALAVSIKAYLEGENVKLSLNTLDLSQCTKFQQSVLRATYSIPRGSVSTYGLIAAHAGIPDGARAVGNVMACNPFPLIVPCHRVIRSDRHIGGYGGGFVSDYIMVSLDSHHASHLMAKTFLTYKSEIRILSAISRKDTKE
jgi:methylated-DNA-[protein]-cysteine S-methyltransferase